MSIKSFSLIILLALLVFVQGEKCEKGSTNSATHHAEHHAEHHAHAVHNAEHSQKCPHSPPTPQICPTNQIYQETGPPTECEGCGARCKLLQSKPQCYCKNGYSRVASGDCIPNADCAAAALCTVNQEYRLSGSACEGCGTIHCFAISDEPNCYCKEGYCRNDNADCVSIQ